MTQEKSPWVALKAIRFGTDVLQPGDPVPVEEGRNYHQMLRLGQIGPASTKEAGHHEEPQELITFQPGEEVLVVYGDGTYDRAAFRKFEEADEQAQESLLLAPGEFVATIAPQDTPDDQIVVPLSSVLPLHPVSLLLDHLEGRARENHETVLELGQARESVVALTAEVEKLKAEGTAAAAEQVTALEGRTAFLELLVQAIKAEGTPLADDTPAVKELRANHITTLEGLRLLTEGEQGRANLIALDKIGEKSADRILAYLNPPRGE